MSKAEGNEHLKAGRHEAAAASYTAALDAQPPPSDEEKAALLANRALAHLKLAKNDRCVADCTAVLQLQPRYVKALYRRGSSQMHLGYLEEVRPGPGPRSCALPPHQPQASARLGRRSPT